MKDQCFLPYLIEIDGVSYGIQFDSIEDMEEYIVKVLNENAKQANNDLDTGLDDE